MALQLYGQSKNQTREEQVRDLLWAMYEDAISRLQEGPNNDIEAGLTILEVLLRHDGIKHHCLLHAMTWLLICCNTPYTFRDWCAAKLAYLVKADEIVNEIKIHHGRGCQGCMLVDMRSSAGLSVDKEDGSECTGFARLTQMCDTERASIQNWNWTHGEKQIKNVTWADESKDVQMPDLVNW